jgi:hypothetical protein
MFGNAIGWVISAIIACIGGYGGYKLLLLAQPTAPSQINGVDWDKAVAKPLNLTDVAAAGLLPMTNPKEDAGDLYRKAIADFDAHPTLYTSLRAPADAEDFDESEIAELKGLDCICQAATCSSMHLFSNHPDEVVGYNSVIPTLDKLTALADAMGKVALKAKSATTPNYALASKYANALAAMGYNLYKERVALCELDAGEAFMGAGLREMVSIDKAEHATAKMEAAQAMDAQRQQESSTIIEPMRAVITGLGDQNLLTHAGDFFEMAADKSIDHVWRVEAIRKIGRLQYYSLNSADQRKAPRVLKRLADDGTEDLIIRTAAAKARDMTSADNQSLR